MKPQTFMFWLKRAEDDWTQVREDVEFRARIAALAKVDPTISMVEPIREEQRAA